MSTKFEKLEDNKAKLTIEVSKEKFDDCLEQSYQKKKKDIKIDGFRPGKAPRKVIETQYGKGVFYEDAIEIAYPDAYVAAVEEHKLFPVSHPEIDIQKVGEDDGLVFTAEIWLRPVVELGEYKGVKVEKVEAELSDKQVEEELAAVAEQSARWIEVEREAKDGDKVIIDFSGSVDGEKFEGGTAEGYEITLGSNTFIEGFEQQLVGMKIGEEKDVNVKFPDEYSEHLAGKDAIFACKLHKIEEKEMPVMDDEFAQDVSEFETLAEYKADLLEKATDGAEQTAKTMTENNVVTKVVENAKFDVPDCMVDSQISYHLQQFEYQLMSQGMKLEDYLNYTGTKIEDMKDQYRDQALNTIRTQLVLETIMEKESLEATEKEIDEELAKNAERLKKTLEEYKAVVPERTVQSVKTKKGFDKTIDFLVEHAKFK